MKSLAVDHWWLIQLLTPLSSLDVRGWDWNFQPSNHMVGSSGDQWTSFLDLKCKVKVTQSCPTLWAPMDCSPQGSSLHGILQARILDCVAISSSRESSWLRVWTQVSCIADRFFTIWATRETQRWTYMFTKEKSFCNRLSLRDWRYLQTFCSQSLLETVKLV